MQIARMRIPVFVSSPSPDNLSPSQEASAEIIYKLVRRYKIEWRALGRSDYPKQALDDLDSVFQNWVAKVRAHYYGD
jgi:hypothetical protein